MMRQYKYMGINWKVNAEKDILGKMDCLLGDYYKESYAPKVDFEVTLVEKISSDLTEILEYGVPITIHNSKKPSVHEEGLVYLNGYIRMIYNKATKSVYRLNYLSKKINIFNKDKSSLVKDGIRVIRDIVKALAEDSGALLAAGRGSAHHRTRTSRKPAAARRPDGRRTPADAFEPSRRTFGRVFAHAVVLRHGERPFGPLSLDHAERHSGLDQQ